jgi:hypothetical protein
MKLFISFLLISVFYYSHGQNWKAFGVMNNVPTCFYEDTINDRFIIGGRFSIFNSDTAAGVISWDGNNFSRMGCGFDWNCLLSTINPSGVYPPPGDFCFYKGVLYATGGFDLAGGKPAFGLAYWNGTNWEPLLPGLTYADGISKGLGFTLRVINDELYVCGFFQKCMGIEANSIAKFDGITWKSVYDIPRFSSSPSFISDVAYYKGYLYVAGDFFDESNMGGDIWDIVRYNGSDWESVGGGIKGGISSVDRMVVYKDKLYMAGNMNKQFGNPGNGIAAWDGEKWDDVGGGIYYNGETHIADMIVNDNKLYVVGDLSYAGGIPASDIAVWDGKNWCGMGTRPSTFDNRVSRLGTYRDTIYIGGGFWSVDGDSSISRIAKWIGGDYVEECGNTTGNPPQPEKEELLVYPNPSADRFTIVLPDGFSGIFNVYNSIGQLIKEGKSGTGNSIEVDLSGNATGLYFVQLVEKKSGEIKTIKFMLR